MNILSVAPLPPHPGGSAVSCALLLSGFADAGHVVGVLSPITAEAQRAGDHFVSRRPDIRVTRFTIPYFETAPNLPSLDDYRRGERAQIRALLPELIRSQRPDVVFVGRETFAWDAPDIAAAHSIPCVVRLAGAATLGIVNGTLPHAEARALLAQYRKASAMISPAAHLARRLEPFGFDGIRVIRNAVDLQRFNPRAKDRDLMRRWQVTADDIVVAHISNLKSLKRPVDLVDSATLALQRDARLLYFVIGDGSERQRIEEACRTRNLSERFRFVGWIDQDAIPAYINLADIVVLPSEDETQARVYLETQACERVILASDIAAAHEVIVDGESGVLFRKADAADLAAKTVELASDPMRRAAIGKAAGRAVQRHALPLVVGSYLEALAAAVSGYPRGG